nr:IS1 family transposase [Leptolyngbya sp. Cla-17]
MEVKDNQRVAFPGALGMVLELVLCPTCESSDVVKHGQSGEDKQRYKCRNPECGRSTFIREYAYRGYLPEVKQQIAAMAVNGSGIRDTARVLKISRTTVIETLKKRSSLESRQRSTFSTT